MLGRYNLNALNFNPLLLIQESRGKGGFKCLALGPSVQTVYMAQAEKAYRYSMRHAREGLMFLHRCWLMASGVVSSLC